MVLVGGSGRVNDSDIPIAMFILGCATWTCSGALGSSIGWFSMVGAIVKVGGHASWTLGEV